MLINQTYGKKTYYNKKCCITPWQGKNKTPSF